jgi:LysR family transcriptional regulator, hca operon transcriptional activator
MDLRYLRFFVAVADERSFTRAAAALHTAQPSLSQQIRRLEDEFVGTPLFHRDKHHVALTEAGRVFLPEARAILQSVDHAVALAQQAARAEIGMIVIGIIPGAEGRVFSHVLPQFQTQHPGIQLTFRSLSTPDQLVALAEKSIDIAFLRPPISDPGLEWEVVMQDSIVAVVPASHPLAALNRIPVASLATLPLVRIARSGAPAVHDLVNDIAAKAGVSFTSILDVDGVLCTLSAVGSGRGFSLLPDYVSSLCPPGVAVRPLELARQPMIDLLVAYRRNTERRPALCAFLKALRASIGKPGSTVPARSLRVANAR